MSGTPTIKIRCRPSFNYNSVFPTIENGASHLKYEGPGVIVRKIKKQFQIIYLGLHSNLPVSYIQEEMPFILRETQYFILCSDEPLARPIEEAVSDYLASTKAYWYN